MGWGESAESQGPNYMEGVCIFPQAFSTESTGGCLTAAETAWSPEQGPLLSPGSAEEGKVQDIFTIFIVLEDKRVSGKSTAAMHHMCMKCMCHTHGIVQMLGESNGQYRVVRLLDGLKSEIQLSPF